MKDVFSKGRIAALLYGDCFDLSASYHKKYPGDGFNLGLNTLITANTMRCALFKVLFAVLEAEYCVA